jgi:hypothetical protein
MNELDGSLRSMEQIRERAGLDWIRRMINPEKHIHTSGSPTREFYERFIETCEWPLSYEEFKVAVKDILEERKKVIWKRFKDQFPYIEDSQINSELKVRLASLAFRLQAEKENFGDLYAKLYALLERERLPKDIARHLSKPQVPIKGQAKNLWILALANSWDFRAISFLQTEVWSNGGTDGMPWEVVLALKKLINHRAPWGKDQRNSFI